MNALMSVGMVGLLVLLMGISYYVFCIETARKIGHPEFRKTQRTAFTALLEMKQEHEEGDGPSLKMLAEAPLYCVTWYPFYGFLWWVVGSEFEALALQEQRLQAFKKSAEN